MKKKKIFLTLLFLALLLVSVLGVQGVYAGKQETINKIDTGVVNIAIDEYALDKNGNEIPWQGGKKVLPGMTVSWIPYFTATGNDCYVRATIDVEQDVETEYPITIDSFEGISNDWIRVGDYYYYKYPLKTKDTVDFFHSFTVPGEWDNSVNPSNIGDWDFSITVVVDAVQSDNFNPDFESDSPWGSITIQESIHKDGYDVNVFTTNSKTDMSVIIEDYDNIVVKPDDFFDGFKTMVPGDKLTDSVIIHSKKNSEIFFSAESLTDIDLLGKMYLKLVIYKDGENTVLYDDVLDADIDKMSLGLYDKNEEATLTFTVYMPKELDNEYALRNASVRWVFEAEPNKNGNPKTGDNNMSMVLLATIMLASGLLIILLLTRRKKKEQDDVIDETEQC